MIGSCGMDTFWHRLKKPLMVLAPMEDVTDAAFRALIADVGKPDVFFTEFTSADGLVLADERGQEKLRKKLLYSEAQHPIVAQLFTSNPAHMEQAARMVADMGFDGVDINMGCPDRAVERSGCGSALIKTPDLARALIAAAKRGWCASRHTACASKACTIETCAPVSVKTRIGYAKNELHTWLPALLAESPAVVTIHARTRNELSDVPARWEHVAEAVHIRDAVQSKTLIFGNGDVRDMRDAEEKAAHTKCDGVMLGRAIYGNPWLFTRRTDAPTPREKIEALISHIEYFDALLGGVVAFAVMKKHFKAYISGWDGARELRARLMLVESSQEAIGELRACNALRLHV